MLKQGTSGGGGSVTSVSGTANRITVTGTTTPVVDIAATYVGQSSITTLGTINSLITSGAAITQADVTANTGAAYTIDQANGTSFNLTMTAATPTLTLQTAPTAGKYQLLYVRLIQDGSGNRAPTFANVTWASGTAPTIATGSGAVTYITFAGNGQVWTGFSILQATDSLTLGALTVNGITTLNGGLVNKVRVVTAAGAVTTTSTDNIVIVNKTVGAATIVNLPSSPSVGQTITTKDGKGDGAANNLTLTPAAGNIDGSPTYVISTNYGSVTLTYNGTQWNVI